MSREHYISRAILERLNKNEAKGGDGALTVEGLHWQERGEASSLPPAALASRVLCDRHNGALSPLDTVAARFFDAVEGALTLPVPGSPASESLILFNGHDLERWLLKVCFGLSASKNLTFREHPGTDASLPAEWLNILFGPDIPTTGAGLYVRAAPGDQIALERAVRIAPLAYDQRFAGLRVEFQGVDFAFLMRGQEQVKDGPLSYRPLELHMHGEAFEHSVAMVWDGAASNANIHIAVRHN